MQTDHGENSTATAAKEHEVGAAAAEVTPCAAPTAPAAAPPAAPEKRASEAPRAPWLPSDASIRAAMGLAAVAGIVALDQGAGGVDPRSGGWVRCFDGRGGNVHGAYWPFGVILTLHALNTAQSAGTGHWLGSLAGNFFATFAPAIAAGVLFRGAALSAEASDANVALATVCWYLVNHAPCGVDAWGKLKSVCGPALDTVLGTASLAYGLAQALGAAGSFGAISLEAAGFWAVFGVGFQCCKAAVVAGAGNHVLLGKGAPFAGFDADADRAAVSAAFMAVVAGFGLNQLDFVARFFGASGIGSAEFVVFANVVIALVNGCGADPVIPNPIPLIQGKLYEISGLRRR